MKLKVALFLAPGNSVATGQHPDTEIFFVWDVASFMYANLSEVTISVYL